MLRYINWQWIDLVILDWGQVLKNRNVRHKSSIFTYSAIAFSCAANKAKHIPITATNNKHLKIFLKNIYCIYQFLCCVLFYFVRRLFEIAPSLKTLFPFGPDPNSPGLRAHALNVVETVGTAVDNLEKLDVLVPVLKDLGRAHAPFELSAKDYEVQHTYYHTQSKQFQKFFANVTTGNPSLVLVHRLNRH